MKRCGSRRAIEVQSGRDDGTITEQMSIWSLGKDQLLRHLPDLYILGRFRWMSGHLRRLQ